MSHLKPITVLQFGAAIALWIGAILAIDLAFIWMEWLLRGIS